MNTQFISSNSPDLVEVCDQLDSFVTALEGLQCLISEQDGHLPRPDLVGEVLYTYVIRAKLCQKALRRATECHYGHLN